ncbi:MAG TPA: lanthionine synthetase LanC family protein [Puia sp.]|jgi:serine/threonine protein kinase|nr:lanthionine synthetase LanC family protein [Puia sp.]
MEQDLDFTLTTAVRYTQDYSEILDKFGFEYKKVDYYLEVGIPEWVQGWILDISVIYTQIPQLLNAILPLLIRERLAFKLALNAKTAKAILNGEFGYLLLGKVLSIYPAEAQRASWVAQKLIDLTKGFRGPEILTDRRLGAVVYTRYGAGTPVKIINQAGIEEAYIYDKQGNLEREPYRLPFQLPEGITWPFGAITSSKAPKKETVLQDKYKPMAFLKEDTKGNVRKGLYLEKLWRIKWCVIKEGKHDVLADHRGRDVTDRLRWQYEVHKDLEAIVPLPRIYDLFVENGDCYLVMEYIHGRSLEKIAWNIFSGKTWNQLDSSARLSLLHYTSQVIEIVEKMHDRGYIHRDITAANFLVDKNQRLWMIDLELAFCNQNKRPTPPFRLGTPGFMSLEQRETQEPTIAQDIYALGALCIYLLTGIMPDKFAQEDPIELNEQLRFFIPSSELIDLLTASQAEDAATRPGISILKEEINRFLQQQLYEKTTNAKKVAVSINREKTKAVIENALNGLASPGLINSNHLWLSKTAQHSGFRYLQNMSMSVYPDFYQGLSGVVWLLARAQRLGFSLISCETGYTKSLAFIQERVHNFSETTPGGLYFGTTGMAVALVEAASAGLIPDMGAAVESIKICLQSENLDGLGITKGLAGKGMALLCSMGLIDDSFIFSALRQIVVQLLALQQKDGSWEVLTEKNSRHIKVTGFGHGVAGIVCFLLSYFEICSREHEVESAVTKALNWLSGQWYTKKGQIRWILNDRIKRSSFDFQNGSLGIMLCLIKAYETFGLEECRRLAQDTLLQFPKYGISLDLTQMNGIAGVGEICLEGARVFGSDGWLDRADWIAQFILHHFHKEKTSSCYWMPDGTPFTTAGLMEGNSGIIHFLMRYHSPKSLSHPLLFRTKILST